MRVSRSEAAKVTRHLPISAEVTVSSKYLTESNTGLGNGCAEYRETPAPDPAQQVGFGIACARPVRAEFVVERPSQDQALIRLRNGGEHTVQPSDKASRVGRENRRARLVCGSLNEPDRLL